MDIFPGETEIKIAVPATAADAPATNTSGSSGIANYQYALDGAWTEITADTAHVFKNIAKGSNHTVSMRIYDAAGNYTEATNKNETVTTVEIDRTGNWSDAAGVNTPDVSKLPVETTKFVTWNYNATDEEYKENLTDSPTSDWYDYSAGKWANIKSTANNLEAYWVWIPRFAYQLPESDTPVEIQTMFLKGTSNIGADGVTEAYFSTDEEITTNGTGLYKDATAEAKAANAANRLWIVHPAFWWDNNSDGVIDPDEQLTGIWVAKYEPSNPSCTTDKTTGNNATNNVGTTLLTVKPNVTSWRTVQLATAFTSCENAVKTGGVIGNNSTTLDCHPAKNIDWGAMAILSQSEYGIFSDGSIIEDPTDGTYRRIWNNSNNNFVTGSVGSSPDASSTLTDTSVVDTTEPYNSANGPKASTTGTVYGVYDTAGGAYEYVMGFLQSYSDPLPAVTKTTVGSVGYSASANTGFNGKLANGTEYNGGSRDLVERKYYDVYSYVAEDSQILSYNRSYIGEAAAELFNPNGTSIRAWNNDTFTYVWSDRPVLERSSRADYGAIAGIFASDKVDGAGIWVRTFRPVLISTEAPALVLDENVTFDYTPKTWRNDSVSVTIATTVQGYTLQYSIDNGTTWNNYTAAVPVTQNQPVIARLYDTAAKRGGDYATFNVTNIDKLAPMNFEYEITDSTPTTITVSASTVDTPATATSGTSNGIKYKYKIDNGEWTAALNDTEYTFTGLTSETEHAIYVTALDAVENDKPADNNGDTAWTSYAENPPILFTGMTAVSFNANGTTNDLVNTSNWYDYTDKQWANARTQDNSLWVWIPRFAYKINYTDPDDHSAGGTIDVVFLDETTNNYVKNGVKGVASADWDPDDYTLHPSFKEAENGDYSHGEWDSELTGYWVSKFEAGWQQGDAVNTGNNNLSRYTNSSVLYSDGPETKRYIGGNAIGSNIPYPVFKGANYSMGYLSVGDAFILSKKLTEPGNIYGLNASVTDSHMIKNSEWGAIAYLGYSQYGTDGQEVYLNNVNLNNTPTGAYTVTGYAGTTVNAAEVNALASANIWYSTNGQKASNNFNITGIYDMVGGATERSTAYGATGHTNLTKGINTATASTEEQMVATLQESNDVIALSTKYATVYRHNGDTWNTNREYVRANGMYGDAIIEITKNGFGRSWNSDYGGTAYSHEVFRFKGGNASFGDGATQNGAAGVFCDGGTSGGGLGNPWAGLRVVLADRSKLDLIEGENLTFTLNDDTPHNTDTDGPVLVSMATTSTNYTLQYSTNGTTWNDYTAAIPVYDNNTAIVARLYDETTRKSGRTATITITNIDKLAPQAFTYEIMGTTATTATIRANATDTPATATSGQSTISYLYGTDANNLSSSANSTFTITGLTAGTPANIIVIAKDEANNQTPASNSGEAVTVGTTSTNYIYNQADLEAFRDAVNGGRTYANEIVYLMNDIDLAGTASDNTTWWSPIGNVVSPTNTSFNGTFEGNNHEISGIYTEYYEGNDRLALFSRINGATIQNLEVSGDIIIETAGSNYATGGLVGIAVGNSRILNCTSNVNVSKTYTGSTCAGIVGTVDADANLLIENCINTGTISGSNNTAGIVGMTYGNLTINNCHNEGNITNTVGTYAGGIIGRDNGSSAITVTITDSSNTGDLTISTTSTANIFTGGIMGFCSATTNLTIDNCYNTGAISATKNNQSNNAYAAGIVAYVPNGANTTVQILNSYNTGAVTGTGPNGISGILAYTERTNLSIYNCYNTGNVNGQYTSGIVGLNNNSAIVTNVYNSGTITGSSAQGAIAIFNTVTSTSNITNTYYKTQTAAAFAGTITTATDAQATGMTDANMQAQAFVTTLNNNITDSRWNSWKYTAGEYPTFGVSPSIGFTVSPDTWTSVKDDNVTVAINATMDTIHTLQYSTNGGSSWATYSTPIAITSSPTTVIARLYNTQTTKVDYIATVEVRDNYKATKVTEIYTKEDLEAFRDSVNAGNDYKDEIVYLMNDIDLGGTASNSRTWWTPIGSYVNDKPFSGTFEGNGHQITNLYGEYDTGNALEQSSLFSYMRDGTIDGIEVSGTIKLGSSDAGSGIAGNVHGESKILNCISHVDVTKTGNSRETAGIVGCIGYQYVSNVLIENCVNTGSISGGAMASGIVAAVYGNVTIRNCHNTGDITNNYGNYAGGIIGGHYIYDGGVQELNVIVEKSYNTGTITSKHSAGGLVGIDSHASNLNKTVNITIKDSYNDGTVNGVFAAGGIIGRTGYASSNLVIDNCYNTKTVTNPNVTITYSQYVYCGGLIGSLYTTGTVECSAEISNSYNTAYIDGTSSPQGTLVGGLVGTWYNTTGSINNCYNTGNVGGDYATGIAYFSTIGSGVDVNNVYNAGIVTGGTQQAALIRTGSNATPNISNTYYLTQTASPIIGSSTAGDATAMSQADMQAQAFVNTLNSNVSDASWNSWKYTAGEYPSFVDEPGIQFKTNPGTWTTIADDNVTVELRQTINTGYALQYSLDKGLTWTNYAQPIPITISPTELRARIYNTGASETIYEATTFIQDDYTYIYNKADLEAFRDQVNAGNTYEGKTVFLMNDIDLGGTASDNTTWWSPIGDYINKEYFRGTFDGNNHEISGIYGEYAEGTQFIALFGRLYDSTIQNLEVSGDIIIKEKVNNTDYVSGAGIAYGAEGNSKILNCTNHINISQVEGISTIAGILAIAQVDSSVLVENCINTGNLGGGSYIGGILGVAYGNLIVRNCQNSGNVTTPGSYAGGMIASDIGTDTLNISISNSYNTGTITCDRIAGGIMASCGTATTNLTINNCYNTANVTSTNAAGNRRIGGILGRVASTNDGTTVNILNSYNTGTITSIENGNNSCVSGILGIGEKSGITISNCYNSGDTSGKYVAGLIGYMTGAPTITNSYNAGTATGTTGQAGISYFASGTSAPDITNTYYINTNSAAFAGKITTATDAQAKSMTEAQMKARDFVVTLNSNITDASWNRWEQTDDSYPRFVKTPSIEFRTSPDHWTNVNRDKVRVTIMETNGTGYTLQYSVDSGRTWTNYTSPITITQSPTIILARIYDTTKSHTLYLSTLTLGTE